MDTTGYCFAPGSKVLLADGSRQNIEYLQRGDLVWTPHGPIPIMAIVECRRVSFVYTLSTVNGVTVSPWYPYRHKGTKEWVRPVDTSEYSEYYMPAVYGIILEAYHSIDVEGLEFVTLGHGFQEPVAYHKYLGTPSVIQAIQNQPGWHAGRPIYQNHKVTHDRVTGEIDRWYDLY